MSGPFYEFKADEVTIHPNGGVDLYEIDIARVGLYLDAKHEVTKKVTPKAGSLIRVYSHGRFCRIDGVDIDGVEIFRKTQQDHLNEWKENTKKLIDEGRLRAEDFPEALV